MSVVSGVKEWSCQLSWELRQFKLALSETLDAGDQTKLPAMRNSELLTEIERAADSVACLRLFLRNQVVTETACGSKWAIL